MQFGSAIWGAILSSLRVQFACVVWKSSLEIQFGVQLEGLVGGFGWAVRLEGPVVEGPVFEGPVFEGPVFEGPVFEGSVFEGPVFEGPVF